MTVASWSVLVLVLLLAHVVRLFMVEAKVPYALTERRIRVSLFVHLVAIAIQGAVIAQAVWGPKC